MRSFLVLVSSIVIAAHVAFAADAVDIACFPPNTSVVFGVSVRTLMDSSLVKSAQSEMQKLAADLMKVGTLPGFDPLKDVDDVIIAATPGKDANGKSTGLILARGHFAGSRPPGTPESYHGIPVFGLPAQAGQPAGVIALLNESTALVGEASEVRAAMDRVGTPSMLKPALADQVRSMSGRFDFWGVGDLPEGYQPSSGSADAMNSVDHFEFGAALRQGLEITGKIHARTSQDAEKMAESIKLIETMFKAQPSSNGTRINLESSNGTIQLSIFISEEDLKKGIDAQKASLAAGMAAQPKPSARQPRLKPGIVTNDRGETVKLTLPGGH